MTKPLIPIFAHGAPRLIEFDGGDDPRDPSLNPLRVDSEDIRLWVEAREPRAVRNWDQLGRQEMARSFTAARTAGQDIIDDLYFAFYDVVAKGGTEVDFERLVMPTLQAKGWLRGEGGPSVQNRVRLIYDTNLRLARASGRWSRYQATKSALPYLRGTTGRDGRVRHPPESPTSDHRAWEGITLPIDHPFWERWFPPLGFRCRCGVIQMSRSQLARRPGGLTSEAELAEREARLGVPVFASPAQGVQTQIAAAVRATNVASMPGARTIDPAVMVQAGASLWDKLTTDEALAGVTSIIERIFGRAA